MSKDIIGINIGSKNTVIGTYKKGLFQIILSDTSARILPTVVSYNDRERNFAELSMHTNRSNFKRTIIYPNRWLGIQKDWPFIDEESKHAYIKPIQDSKGRLGFNIDYKRKKEIYTPECLMGLFFSKLQNIWLRENINTKEIVVSVPDYYTAHERKAMLEAIEIGGLKSTALLNESSAITFAYYFQKMKEFEEGKPRTVAFVDLGHSSCNIFFSTFTKKDVKVVSVTNERFCGAREFDYLIAKKLAEDFNNKYDADPMSAPKCRIRLIDTITKVRKSLTVNKEVIISVDSLMEGEDLVYNLTRDEFEKIIDPVVKKFENLCKVAIEKFEKETKLKLSNIHSIEMVGDTVRTPIILETIKKTMGKEISKTLVPDECISRGCALYAMMNSPHFTLQNFSYTHYNPYEIEMEYPYISKDGKEIIKKYCIIKKGDINLPASKTITFTSSQLPNKEIIPLKFYYVENPNINWLPNKLLNSYNIHLKKKKEKDWKFILKYGLDLHGIPKLEESKMIETKIEMVPVVETPKVKEEKKDDKKPEDKKPEDKKSADKKDNDKKSDEKKDCKKSVDEKQEAKKPEKEQSKPEEKKSEDKKPDDKKIDIKKEEKKEEKPRMKEVKTETETKLDADIVDVLFGIPKGMLEAFIKRENTQSKDDRIFREASNLKNSLEQYIYTTKEKLDSQLKGYYTDKERQDLTKFMDELMKWLYSEDEKLYDKPTLEQNSSNMKNLGDEIYKREENWRNLRNNYNIFESIATEKKDWIKNEEEKLKKKEFTYLTVEDIAKINQLINDAIENATKKRSIIDKAPQIRQPPVLPDEIDMLSKNLRQNVKKVYDDAEFKVKEEERKRKEEEEKKKKEEEEKKKKEEEEKKKKEEEEKKKKEEEKKLDKKDENDKKEDKQDKKKDNTNQDNDVEMKDETKPKEETMDVE
jgi:molecular chaperone DnaK (HSP70)